jgi:predicted ATPase
MITKIEAVNFRCLRNVSQTLGNFHVLTGPNGSGKSTFLGVANVIGLFAQEGLDAVWNATRARAFEELTFCGQGDSFQLAVESALPEELILTLENGNGGSSFSHVRYEVEIGAGEVAGLGLLTEPRILAENLWLLGETTETPRRDLVQSELLFPSESIPGRRLIHPRTPKGWRKIASKTANQSSYFHSETTDWHFQIRNPAQKSALSTLPEDERFSRANWFKSQVVDRLQKIMLHSDKMLEPSSPLKQRKFAVDGSNLPQVIQDLQKDKPSYEGWLDHLRSILAIKRIEVHEKPEDRRLFFDVHYDTGLHVHSWQLSDGTLRLLALTMLAYASGEPATYLIEEPENGVHPQAVEAVYQSLSGLNDGQVLVATHSPVMVAQVTPGQLLCFSKGPDDSVNIIRGDQHPKLKDWQGALDLAQLYAAGILS